MLSSKEKLKLFTGGIILNLVIPSQVAGNIINFGILIPYIASYYYHIDHSVRTEDFSIVPFIGFIAESLFSLELSYISKHLSLHNIILIFSSLCCVSMFMCSFITNPYLFSWVYGLSLGTMAGCIFLPSVWILWSRIPENKAYTSGILLSGYSVGSVPFGFMFTLIVNPDDKQANSAEGDNKMFGKEVTDNVPMGIRLLSSAYLACILIGLLLVPRKTVKNPEERKTGNRKIKDLISTKTFWSLSFMMLMALSIQSYIQIVYKVIAIKFINDDYYSTYVGVAAYISCGVGRTIFGYLLSRYYWKKVMGLVYFIESILMFGLWFTVRDKALYAFFMVFCHFLSSALYNNILNLTEKMFPGNKLAISLLSLFQIPGLFISYILDKFITPRIGYLYTFIIVAIFSVLLIFQLVFFDDKRKVDEAFIDSVEN